MKLRFEVVVLFAIVCPVICWAQVALERGQSIYLHKTVVVPITPQDAFFLIEYSPDGIIKRQRGILVPVNEHDVDNARWLVGTKVNLPPDAQALSFSIVLVSKDNRYFFFSARDHR